MFEEKTNDSSVQKNITLPELEKILSFDMDKNGFPKLTAKNVALIEFIIHNDSNYRALDDSDKDSISEAIIRYYDPKNFEKILKIVEVIDKQNSTHLSSMGRGHKGDNSGRLKTAKYIAKIHHDFNVRLKNRDFELVNDIAKNAIPPLENFKGRYVFSFASKYCTYVARTIFEKNKEADNFSIFDDIICEILPYYAWTYLGENNYCRIKSNKRRNKEIQSSSPQKERVSTIKDIYGKKNKGNYKGYCELIDRIRYSAKNLFNDDHPISRKGFDHLLWYYFKGKKPNSRVINAINLVGKESSRLLKDNP